MRKLRGVGTLILASNHYRQHVTICGGWMEKRGHHKLLNSSYCTITHFDWLILYYCWQPPPLLQPYSVWDSGKDVTGQRNQGGKNMYACSMMIWPAIIENGFSSPLLTFPLVITINVFQIKPCFTFIWINRHWSTREYLFLQCQQLYIGAKVVWHLLPC